MKVKSDQLKRSYGQWCGIARALDIVGERWSLLIVRNLLVGPKRYRDLLDGLPGIGTNLLARRLRDLEGYGVVERAKLPAPASATVYQLTRKGLELEPVVLALGSWGWEYLGEPQPTDAMSSIRSSSRSATPTTHRAIPDSRGGMAFASEIGASTSSSRTAP